MAIEPNAAATSRADERLWLDWAAAAPYLLCALLCFRAGRHVPESRTWTVLAAVYATLGIGRQHGLHAQATDLGRALFLHFEHYQDRRGFQAALIAVVMAAAAAACVVGWRRLGRSCRGARLAAAGCVVTSAYVAVRVASLHDVDELAHRRFAGVEANIFFENIGSILTAAGALTAASRDARRPRFELPRHQ